MSGPASFLIRRGNQILGLLAGILLSALLGVLHFWLFSLLENPSGPLRNVALGLLMFSFVLGVPFAMGYLSVWVASRKARPGWWFAIFFPWWAILFYFLLVLAIKWEGVICLAMVAPAFLMGASGGGVLAAAIRRYTQDSGRQNFALALIVLAPLLVSPVEAFRKVPLEIQQVETRIEISANPERIWSQVASFAPIRPEEHRFSFFHFIGFPQPREALLDHEGVGGIRTARFEKGVEFYEKITNWDPPRYLEFSIDANTHAVRPDVLDRHVLVGGKYFDVLRGKFRIESLGPERSLLYLSSDHRVTSLINPYARLWTRWLMEDIQDYLLRIVKERSENVHS